MYLPTFKYHPNPYLTGSVSISDTVCRCCNQNRGYIYVGPTYCEQELIECICPWCIADGAAAAKFKVEFIDSAGIGGFGDWDEVSPDVVEELSKRTPGFFSWQGEMWFTCCGDAAEFLGYAGSVALVGYGEGVRQFVEIEAQKRNMKHDDLLCTLDFEGSPRAYVFRCRKCMKYGGYVDED